MVNPSLHRHFMSPQKAFSLLEMSIVITIMALVAVMGLEATSFYMGRTAFSSTKDKLATIDQALRDYYNVTGRLPCPAKRLASSAADTAAAENYSGSSSYGMESCASPVSIYPGTLKTVYASGGTGYAAGAATITGGGGAGATATCAVSSGAVTSVTITAAGSGFTSAPTITCPSGSGATLVAGVSTVYAGAVPVVELGLPVSAGIDAYGSKINYVVTQGLTDSRTFPTTPPNIAIRSGKLLQPCATNCQVVATPAAAPADYGAMYAVFSNGADQRGSVTRNGARRNSTAANNCLSATTSRYDLAIDSQNCAGVDSATLDTATIGGTIPGNVIYDSRYNPFLNNESLYFDDILMWRTKGQL